MDYRFKSCIPKGITTFYSLIEKGKLKDFQQLRDTFTSGYAAILNIRLKIQLTLMNQILRIFISAYQNDSKKEIISKSYKGQQHKNTAVYVKEK